MGTDNKIDRKNIVFFDGVCNLCNSAINFLIDLDKGKRYSFSSLQSDFASTTLSKKGVDPTVLKTIILLDEKGNVFFKSDAVFEVLAHTQGIWKMLTIFRFVPKFIRDFFYDVIANNRYRLFGKKDSCRIPTPELKQRFLDAY